MNKFATPTPIIKVAFERVMAGVVMGWWRSRSLHSAFRRAHQRGGGECEAVERVLIDQTWAWPWFDQCSVVFADTNKWPIAWQQLDIVPSPGWYAIPDRVKANLMAATLVAASYNTRNIVALVNTARATGAKLTVKPGDERCPAEAHFAQLHKRAIERGNYSRLPPYFPGDTTAIRVHG